VRGPWEIEAPGQSTGNAVGSLADEANLVNIRAQVRLADVDGPQHGARGGVDVENLQLVSDDLGAGMDESLAGCAESEDGCDVRVV
jgi:hypothetical protein